MSLLPFSQMIHYEKCRHKNTAHENTCTVLITHWSEQETHEDGSCNGANIGSPCFLCSKTQRLLDLWHKRSNGEPNEESKEERKPGAVECSHVWSCEGAKFDLSSFVSLVRVYLTVIFFVSSELVVL